VTKRAATRNRCGQTESGDFHADLVLPRTTKFGRSVVEERISKGSATPLPQRGGAQRFPILGVPYIYAYTLCRRSTKFDVVTHVGWGVYLGSQPRLPSEESAVPGLRNFGGSLIFMATPFNAE